MAPKQGDGKRRGNPEAQQASEPGSASAQAPERREGRRRGGRRKEAPVATEPSASPERPRKRGRGKTGELQRAGDPAPVAQPAPAQQAIPSNTSDETPQAAPELRSSPRSTSDEGTQPAPASEPAPQDASCSEPSEPIERRTVPPSIPAPPPSARAPGFHVITEGPPKLNRTEPPAATLRTGEAPPVREIPAPLTRALEELPAPFGAFSLRWRRAASDTARTLAIAAGIDASARLLCAAWLGAISASAEPRMRMDAGTAIISRAWYRRELPASAWMQMNFRLASILANRPEGVLGSVARALADAGGLAEDLSRALDGIGPNASNDPASLLVELFGSLLSLCRPLRGTRLLGFAGRSIVAGEGEALWKVRDMRGLSPSPELQTEWFSGPITPGSCLLISSDSECIPLAPLLSAQLCLDCSSLEVHAADSLVLGTADRAVRCLRCGRSSKDRTAHPHLRRLARSVHVWSAL